ncbi:MAG: ABC transporter ATP-binding protein [Clostridia bacterium]|nr:ABC transporter ATP-binding protein [Clostridia bacterium]
MQRMGPRGFLTDDEKKNLPKVTWPLIRRILSYLAPYWVRFVMVFATILISAVLGLLPSIITGRIVDEALVGESMKLLIQLILAALATMIASQLVSVLTSYLNAWISQHIIFDMKNQMYAHLQQMSHAFFTTERQGDVITRMNSDISGVSSVISGTLQNILSNLATVITTLAALFGMNWKMAIIGILVIPLLVLPTRSAGRQRWKLLSDGQAKHDEMNQLINETLSVSGSMLTKLFTREKREYERFMQVNGEVTKLALKEQLSGRWFRLTMGIFTQLGPLLIYFTGGYLIIVSGEKGLTVGMITAMVALVNRLYRPVESLLNIQVDFTRSMALFTRIFDYFDRPIDIKSPENGKKPDLSGAEIRFEHVRFGYTEDKEILHDVDFVVRSGEMAAIVGGSGSGKSTVINFIPRLWDVKAGRVLVGGVDVRDFDLHWLRSQIGMVSQDTYLFNGTIRENLRYAKEDATDEELIAACKAASIHDFIVAQPDGYDTEVGNRGLKLSGGEKQRLSIARVILKDPKILILDEATSALDSISEAAIQDALDYIMKGRTSIVIAHRLSTIMSADKILVLADGRIAQCGTHDQLLREGGVYRHLFETQFSKVLEMERSLPENT